MYEQKKRRKKKKKILDSPERNMAAKNVHKIIYNIHPLDGSPNSMANPLQIPV